MFSNIIDILENLRTLKIHNFVPQEAPKKAIGSGICSWANVGLLHVIGSCPKLLAQILYLLIL